MDITRGGGYVAVAFNKKITMLFDNYISEP